MNNQFPISLYFEYVKNSINTIFWGGQKSVPYGHFHTIDISDREQMRLLS